MILLLLDFWATLGAAQEFIVAVLLSLVTAGLLSFFRPKVKLIWGSTSQSYHKFTSGEEEGPVLVTTEKLYVQNVGKKPASNVELILTDVPTSYTLWSPREHRRGPMSEGGFFIAIPSIAPSELLIIDTIDVAGRDSRLISVNSPDTISKEVKFGVERQFNNFFNWTIYYLVLAGFVGTLYLILLLLSGFR